MKTHYLKKIIFVLLLLPLTIYAQHRGATQSNYYPAHDARMIPLIRMKFYGGVGGTLYGGELTGRQILGSNNMLRGTRGRPAATIGIAYKLTNRFFVKAELSYCFIKGSETKETMEKFGRKQNFQFRSDNYDLILLGQYNILPYAYLPYKHFKIVPYVVVGIGATTSRPKGYFNNDWQSLKDLSNGQIKNRVLVVLPVGIGCLYRINNNWDIGLDATMRYTLGAGSLDGDSDKGVSTQNLSADGKRFFDQYYNPNIKTVLKDHQKFNDLYSVLQIRLQYTFIPYKYKHLLKLNYLNHYNFPRGHLR
jgi:outer membrane protein W